LHKVTPIDGISYLLYLTRNDLLLCKDGKYVNNK